MFALSKLEEELDIVKQDPEFQVRMLLLLLAHSATSSLLGPHYLRVLAFRAVSVESIARMSDRAFALLENSRLTLSYGVSPVARLSSPPSSRTMWDGRPPCTMPSA